MKSRRATVKIKIEGSDVNIEKSLLSFDFSDKSHGKADDISLSLADHESKWIEGWFPVKEEKITAVIEVKNWENEDDIKKLDCGTFLIDEPEYRGMPGVISIKGVSKPSNTDFTENPKTESWENTSFREISESVAKRSNLKYKNYASTDPTYDWKEQQDMSDIKFLKNMTEEEGLNIKISNESIIIYDQDSAKLSDVIIKKDQVNSFSFKRKTEGTAYSGVRIKYYNHYEKKEVEYLEGKEGKVFDYKKRVSSIEEAKRIAKATYKKINRNQFEGNISMRGNTELVAGIKVKIEGFGIFDNVYFIDEAKHSISSGYKTSIKIVGA